MKTTPHFFTTLYRQLLNATRPEDVFGDLSNISHAELKQCFRKMAQQVHPDRHHGDKAEANEAFQLLQKWYQVAQMQVGMPAGQLKIRSKRFEYVNTAVSQPGDLCDIYPAKADNSHVMLKIVRQPKNNDLMQAEAKHLKRIYRGLNTDPLLAHFPTLIESFKMQDEQSAERYINVLADEQAYVRLADIIAAYPHGIHPADAAWMFNRTLVAIAKTHELGLIHGAVLPSHIMLRLEDHNGMLIDWCYSVESGERIKAISPSYKAFYPPEVFEKQAATPATDIYMAAMTLLAVLGGDPATKTVPPTVPKAITALIKSCLIASPHRRPNDAWEVFESFQDILGKLYGAPKFRPFVMPGG